VAASETLTPADIEYAARVAAQAAFERELVAGETVEQPGASTQDYLDSARQVRPTVTAEMVREFQEDIERFARL